MIKKLMLLLLIAAALTACKARRQQVTAPNATESEDVSIASLKKALSNKPAPPVWVKMLAEVSIVQDNSSITAMAEIRMRQDSILWIELSDNLVGIKVARGFAMADTVAFFNRIDKTWYAGNYNYIEEKIKTKIPFEYLFRVFQAILFENDLNLSPQGTFFTGEKKMKNGYDFYAVIDPAHLDITEQKLFSPTDAMFMRYSNFKEIAGYRFPHNIEIDVEGRQKLSTKFVVREIQIQGPYKTPFSISNNYVRIR